MFLSKACMPPRMVTDIYLILYYFSYSNGDKEKYLATIFELITDKLRNIMVNFA